jgi:hypothetical protein
LSACFSRRRCTDEESASLPGIWQPCDGRYRPGLAQHPDQRVVGEHLRRRLGVDQLADAVTHRFGRVRLFAVRGRDGRGEEILSSKMPRLVAMYLLAVTRETVDSRIEIASAAVRRLSGRKCRTPWAKNPSCWRTISVATLRMVRALGSTRGIMLQR